MNEEQTRPRLISIEDAAAYCGVSVSTFRREYVRKGGARVQLASCVRFDRADLDAWIDAHKTPAVNVPRASHASATRASLASSPRVKEILVEIEQYRRKHGGGHG